MAANKTLDQLIEDYGLAFWASMEWPEAVNSVGLVNLITERCGALCPWIQDATQLKSQITFWAADKKPNWERIALAMSEEYNPIYNYFREELGSEEIAHHKGTHRSTAYKDTETPAVSVTNTGSVVAYDSNTERETGQSVQTPTGTNTRQGLASENYTEERDIDANTYDRDEHSFTGRITQGNIGVTQTVDMIEAERRLRTAETLMEIIAEAFEDRFMVQVY